MTTQAQCNKGMWPAPVYIAHYSDGKVRRMSFWSKVGQPMDTERGKRLCLSVDPTRHLVYGEIDLDGDIRPVESFSTKKPRVSNVKVRMLALDILDKAKTYGNHAIVPVELLTTLRQELAA